MSFLNIFLPTMMIGIIIVAVVSASWGLLAGLSKLLDWLIAKLGDSGEVIYMITLGGFIVPFILSIVFWVIAKIGGVS